MLFFKHIIMGLLLTTAAITSVMADKLTATIPTPNVMMGDSFRLTLSTGEHLPAPDFSPLNKDFQLLGTSQNSRYTVINGKVENTQSWVLTLSPKKTGTLTIPAVTAGTASSKPLTITVLDADKASKLSGTNQDITITTRLNGKGDSFYPFQEIPLTVRVELSVPTRQLHLLAPTSADIELSQHGKDRSSRTTRNGKNIIILERDYNMRANKAGQLTLPPFILKGQKADPNYRDPMADFNRHFDSLFGGQSPFNHSPFAISDQPFSLAGNRIDFKVKARPNQQADEWFLPAKSVELQAHWQPDSPTFKQGEAVTRIIRLQATGARAEQLPELDLGTVDGAKIYVDNNRTQTQETPDGTLAIREISLSVVPTRSGEITLPQIAVKWFNTDTDTAATSFLPTQTIQVVADNAGKTNKPPTAKSPKKSATAQTKSQPPMPDKQATATTDSDLPHVEQPSKTDKTLSTDIKWGLIAVIIALVFVIMLVLWRLRRLQKAVVQRGVNAKISSENDKKDNTNPLTEIKKSLDKALKNNDSKQLYQAILQWQQQVDAAKHSTQIENIKSTLETALFQSEKIAAISLQPFAKTLQQQWKLLNDLPDNQRHGLPPLYNHTD